MSFLKSVYNVLTDKREIKEPIVYKDLVEESSFMQNLTKLSESSDQNIDLKKVDHDLKLFSIGQAGEKSVIFELQNSMLPFIVLHDVYLEFEDYYAQMDFVIITHKFILVLEVKKLFGNIKVTDKGEFQRVITKNNRVINKEGMYSPINQVERQVAILEKFLKEKGLAKKCPVRHAVTFANPKTILDISKKAPSNIQSSIIRHDQIRSFLTSELEKDSKVFMFDGKLYDIAETLLQNCKEKNFNIEKYTIDNGQALQEEVIPIPKKQTNNEKTDDLKTTLTEFRLERSKKLDMKAYHIFTNKTLDELVEKQPGTMGQLLKIEGIGQKKAEDFGEDIVAIIVNSKKIADVKNSTVKQGDIKTMLTTFRTNHSKQLNVKPFYIFTNKTLEAIIETNPKTIKELLEIEGMGPKKVDEFGGEILAIVRDAD
ncbi:HRDC domain-containing protein [Virgibacillus sp. L01]|uniref:HRDC domain-containing protein n=1 Tax=Virgibacillus sp. L01 TaxID=3457429 RepID=UPI003FD5581B